MQMSEIRTVAIPLKLYPDTFKPMRNRLPFYCPKIRSCPNDTFKNMFPQLGPLFFKQFCQK